jgi:hypothetical protein
MMPENPVGGPGQDQGWDQAARRETLLERLDRNWGDLLQELRVVQTGVQLLTGFLLTLPFQARFANLTRGQQNIYLVTVIAAVAATAVLITPVAIHRILFRQHARSVMVTAAHYLACAGTLLLGAAVTGVVLLIFDVLRGPTAGIIAAAATGAVAVVLWVALPVRLYLRNKDQ